MFFDDDPRERRGLARPLARLLADADRRRAVLLSVLAHALVLLGVVVFVVQPGRNKEPEKRVLLEFEQPQAGAPAAAGAAKSSPAAPPARPQTPAAAREPVREPAIRVPAASPARPLPMPQVSATALPTIAEVETAPAPPVAVPTPAADAEVSAAQSIATQARAEVTPEVPIALPAAQAQLPQRDVQLPLAEAEVAAARPLPEAAAEAEVAPPQSVPVPSSSADVVAAQSLPSVQARAAVTPAAPLPSVVSEAQVTPARNISAPVSADVAPAREVSAAASASVTPAAALELPAASAVLARPQAPATGATPAPQQRAQGSASAAQNAPGRQDTGAEGNSLSGLGEGRPAPAEEFTADVEHPLAVLLDNSDAAYPQTGLAQASQVLEMPVEGGMSRLMAVFSQGDPRQVGPVRSARDYFLEAARNMDATLVHVGGAPSTQAVIAGLPKGTTIDAMNRAEPFTLDAARNAPHNTYAETDALRAMSSSARERVSGTRYAPPQIAPPTEEVDVRFSAAYGSSFNYLKSSDQYQWLRNGQTAKDANGQAIVVDAVVMASVEAAPYAGDPAGRLFLPYAGGAATLYLHGKMISGSWSPQGGFSFISDFGEQVSLTPFKSWVIFAPTTAQITQR